MKKQTLYTVFGVVVITLACSFITGTPATPTQQVQSTQQMDAVGTIVAATMQALTIVPSETVPTEAPTEQAPTETAGKPVSFEHVAFVIPNEVAGNANTETMMAVDTNSVAPWDVAPTHLRFTLTDYQLANKFHDPRIFVYPADEFAQVNEGAAEQIERVKKILAGSALMKETLPNVPFFNAGPLIAANIQIIKFQNGSGVRVLTEYAQYFAPINNHELFYHFQGLTNDNKYYVIAILPITAPILAEDEKTESPVPAEGVPFPTGTEPGEVYYFAVTEKLNSLPPDSYTPSLSKLDALIQSLRVTNP